MTQALVLTQNNALAAQEDIFRLGDVFARSGYFQDAREAQQAIVKILAGRELGIPPVAAMTGIYLINGRVALGANLIAAAIKRSGRYDYRVQRLDNEACEIVFFQGTERIGESTFTLADARKAGTKNTEKFARNMLFARAISNGARWHCPDIFGGPIYTPEELGASVNDEGEVVNFTPVRPQLVAAPIEEATVRDAALVQNVKDLCSHLNAQKDLPPVDGAEEGGWKPAVLNAYAIANLGAPFKDLNNLELEALNERLLNRGRALICKADVNAVLAEHGQDVGAFWSDILAEFDGRELCDLSEEELGQVMQAAKERVEQAAF